MATIDIRKPHTVGKDEARKMAEDLAKNLEGKIGIQWKWEGDAIRFDAPSGAAKGVKGQVAVSDSEVHVQVDLPFLLKMLKGTIETRINEKLSQLG